MKKLFLIITVSALFVACTSPKGEQSEAAEQSNAQTETDAPSPVKAMKLSVTDFQHDLVANGTIVSQRKAELRFETSASIVRVYVKNGDRVSKGHKIAELDRFKLRSAMLQANDNLERARLELQDVLIGQGYSLRDSLKVPVEVMKIARIRSNYDQSLNSYQMATYNYSNAVLLAPFAGVVANLFTKEYNTSSGSEALCTIIDNQHPEVEFKILESEVALVKKGDKVKVSPYAMNSFTSTGTITEINPLIDKNGMVYIKALLPASEKLMDGMNVKILIQRRVSSQLVIPKEALVLRTNKKVVFTLRNGQANWNYITTGLENSTGYVITEGLQAGDSVIYEGNINLAHESPVVIVK
jgi:membrane fusion protein, multidrug efflux system